MDALTANDDIEKVWIDKGLKGDFESEIRYITRKSRIPLQYVPKEKLSAMAGNTNHQGVVAQLSIINYMLVEEVLPYLYEAGKTPFFLVLDGIEDVRNIGAIARSAVWFGVDALVVSLKKTARINSFTYKTSAGAIKDIIICRETSMIKSLEYMKNSGIQIVVADVHQNENRNTVKFNEPIALVLGSEEKGVVREIAALANAFVMIEGTGKVESLNVSVAGAILMHKVYTHRNS